MTSDASPIRKLRIGVFDNNHLPSILLANVRSIASKLDETELVVSHLAINIIVLTETWLTASNRNTVSFNDYIPHHRPREQCKKSSGGVSILVSPDMVSTKLQISVPNHLECLWLSCRPIWLPRSVSVIVVCAVYYPGSNSDYAPNQSELIDHITDNILKLKVKYSEPLFFVLGDFNDLNIDPILKICQLSQKVKVPTRGNSILDLILTNACDSLYYPPYTIPKIGKSDHHPVVYDPRLYKPPPQIHRKEKKREFPKSAILSFGFWITRHRWPEVIMEDDPYHKVNLYSSSIWYQINKHFPEITVRMSSTDKPWFTTEIKQLIAMRHKFHLLKNFDARDQLNKTIKKKCFELRSNFRKHNIHLLNYIGSKNWYRQINSIINPDKCSHKKLSNIPELSGKHESTMAEIVNNKFAEICCAYPPLDHSKLPAFLPHDCDLKYVTELEIYILLKKVSSKSPGIGDIPPRILSEFAAEIATPICNIINASLYECTFPSQWKKAKIIPIPKSNPPVTLADLRPISLTPAPGKVLEKILSRELSNQTKTKLDNCQYGNTKGSSTTHYLIKLLNMAYVSTEEGKATTAVTIDYSKAFDYIDHTILINKLINMGIKASLVKILMSFLTDRSQCTKIGSEISSSQSITCGVPQGTINGPKLFVIMIDGDTDDTITNFKFVDDKTIALNHSDDPTQLLQDRLDLMSNEADQNHMVINAKKCHSITFNFSDSNKPPENLHINNAPILREKAIKLLGVEITDNLKFSNNTKIICKKVNSMFFKLSKMKSFGATRDDLVKIWTTILRPCAEYASPVWHPGLTLSETKDLEKLQKTALAIILGRCYINSRPYYKVDNTTKTYDEALNILGLESLKQRREDLITKFAKDILKSSVHRSMLPCEKSSVNTRQRLLLPENPSTNKKEIVVLKETKPGSMRYENSPIPYMTRTINKLKLTRSIKNEKNIIL